ncbi:MAG TPA: protease, partial [Oxalicibacterium sp.]
MRSLVLLTSIMLALALPAAHAQKETDRNKQKKAAEAERADLRQKLNELKRSIDKTESAKSDAADALAESEAAISDAKRDLRELAGDQKQTQAKLDELSKQMTELQKTVESQQGQLASLLRDQYVAGNEDRIKLLLSGDNPNRINRELQYMGYVSRAQAELIESLRANLHKLEEKQAEVQNAKAELDEIAAEARKQQAILQKQKAQRAALLSQLSNKLTAQRKEAGNIARNERRLSTLVDKLTALIAEQKRAAAAAARKRAQERRERLARAKAERERRLAQNKKTNPDAIEDDEPPEEQPAEALAHNELTPVPGMQDGAFPALRGKLRLPIAGDLIARYG